MSVDPMNQVLFAVRLGADAGHLMHRISTGTAVVQEYSADVTLTQDGLRMVVGGTFRSGLGLRINFGDMDLVSDGSNDAFVAFW